MVIKPRQAWVSSVIQAETIEYLRRNPATTAYIITHKDEATFEFRDRAIRFSNSIPEPFHIPITKDREGLFVLANDSRLHIQTAGGKMVALATSVQNVHVTEAWAMEEEARDIIYQAFEAVPLGGSKIIETTAGRFGSMAHQIYTDAKRGEGKRAHFYAWWWVGEYRIPRNHPEFPSLMAPPPAEHELMLVQTQQLDEEQIAWRRVKVKELGEDYFQMIYPEDDVTMWMATSGGFFDNALLAGIIRKGLPDPLLEYA